MARRSDETATEWQERLAAEHEQVKARVVRARVRYNRTGKPRDLEMLKRLMAERERVKAEEREAMFAYCSEQAPRVRA